MAGFGLLAVGLLFCWLAFSGWRQGAAERISIIVAAILKTTGAEPLPLTRIDTWLQRFQLVMLSVFGPSMTAVGLLILLT
jgi:hypothetical protein